MDHEHSMGLWRRLSTLRLGAAMVAWAVCAGCGSAAPPGGAAGSSPAADRTRSVRLIGRTSKALDALRAMSAGYRSDSGAQLEVSGQTDARDIVARLQQDAASGRNSYDLAVVPHRFLGQLAAGGVIAPVDTLLADTSLPPGIDGERDLFTGWWRMTAWHGSRPYGYPLAARTMSLWTRGDFWDEEDADAFFRTFKVAAAPPKTWDEFERMAAFQHRPDRGRYGTVVAGAPDDGLWTLWLQVAYSLGARLFADEDGAIAVNSPEALRATELYLRLLRLSPPGAADFGMEEALRAFQAGDVAMAVMWHDLSPRLDDREESMVPMRSGYERSPGGGGPQVTLLEADLLVMTRPSRDAFAAMRWALSHDVQREITLRGGFSARPSVYTDPAVARHRLRHMWSYPRLAGGAVPVPSLPESDRIAQLMAQELSAAVHGRAPAGEALDRIAVRLGELFGGRRALRYPPNRR